MNVTFGNDPIFGALAVALPDLAPDFGGDLLTLTVLDVLASRYKVPISLSTVWEKLLNADEIARFLIACGKGYQIDTAGMSFPSSLKSMAQSSLNRQQGLKARSGLLAILQDISAQLDADEENEILAGEIYGTSPRVPDADYESEAYYEHLEMLEQDAYRNSWIKRVKCAQDKRYQREREQHACRKIIELGLETAAHMPAEHFRIDLCRKGMTEPVTRSLQTRAFEVMSDNTKAAEAAKEGEQTLHDDLFPSPTPAKATDSGLQDEGGEHLAADSGGILSIPHALGDVRLGALSSSDGSERWDYGRPDDFNDDDDDDDDDDHGLYGRDDDSESPRDYAACSLDDCGYCGHCSY